MILEENGFVAYTPFAASSDGLVRVAPLQHASDFTDASPALLLQLSRQLRLLLSMLDSAFNSPAYNLILVMPPKVFSHDPSQHWYLDLIPRLARTGGFELATGLSVSSLMPEQSARIYRQARSDLELSRG
jgi:UDPglucose--hexose-1-phosphate uridylyltransferase